MERAMTVEPAHRHQDLFQKGLNSLPRQRMLNGPQNHRMFRAGDIVADQQFLVELLCRTQPGVPNLDISLQMLLVAHRQSHEIDHAPRQIPDPNRLAHVEHEYIAALRHRPGLDHELRGLRNGHEVADHVGMSHGYRATGLDLFIEQRHHRTGRRQNVAEPHHAKARLAAAPLQTLQHDFRESLGRPDDVLFDDRDMFVRRSVVHGLHAVRLQDVAQAKLVVSVADQSNQIDGHAMLIRESAQLALTVVERQFGNFKQHQPFRAQAYDLPTELGAYGASGPGHHDHPIANAGVEQTRFRRYRISSQQVADVDFANLFHWWGAG